MATALCNATIFTGEAMVEGHALLIKHGKILDIIGHTKVPSEFSQISYPGQILVPGFIDAQVNGGDNILFNNNPTPETCIQIAKAHQKYGTTRILPTCITDKPEILEIALNATRIAQKTCKNILGIHIEGPHLSQERRGVHSSNYIRKMTPQDLKLYHPVQGEVMLITVAPESVTPREIKALRQQGLIVSLGHTNATPDQIRLALSAGATGFTHLFNGMGKPSPNGKTPADTALKDKDSWCGMIMDGFHVPWDLAQLAILARPKKIFLVSDAMPPAATNHPLPFMLYDKSITLQNGRCVNHEGKLAGSSITLIDAVKNCVRNLDMSLEESFRMASHYPATFLGLENTLGKLLPGYKADVAILNPELEVQATHIAEI